MASRPAPSISRHQAAMLRLAELSAGDLLAQVMGQRPAAARTRRDHDLDAVTGEQPDRRLVDSRTKHGLHAAAEQRHALQPRAFGLENLRPVDGRSLGQFRRREPGHGAEPPRQEPGRRDAPDRPGAAPSRNSAGSRQHDREQLAQPALANGTSEGPGDVLAGMIHQMHVMDARGAGGHAGEAGKAAVDMLGHGRRGRLPAFQHVLDQIDAPARTVEFVARAADRSGRSRCRSRNGRRRGGSSPIAPCRDRKAGRG